MLNVIKPIVQHKMDRTSVLKGLPLLRMCQVQKVNKNICMHIYIYDSSSSITLFFCIYVLIYSTSSVQISKQTIAPIIRARVVPTLGDHIFNRNGFRYIDAEVNTYKNRAFATRCATCRSILHLTICFGWRVSVKLWDLYSGFFFYATYVIY